MLAGALAPGTDFLWRDGKLLTWRSIGVPGMATPPAPVPGYVRGLVPGAQAAEVAFGGTAVGYSGTVEIRLIYRDSGTVALDWTPLGTIADRAMVRHRERAQIHRGLAGHAVPHRWGYLEPSRHLGRRL